MITTAARGTGRRDDGSARDWTPGRRQARGTRRRDDGWLAPVGVVPDRLDALGRVQTAVGAVGEAGGRGTRCIGRSRGGGQRWPGSWVRIVQRGRPPRIYRQTEVEQQVERSDQEQDHARG